MDYVLRVAAGVGRQLKYGAVGGTVVIGGAVEISGAVFDEAIADVSVAAIKVVENGFAPLAVGRRRELKEGSISVGSPQRLNRRGFRWRQKINRWDGCRR